MRERVSTSSRRKSSAVVRPVRRHYVKAAFLDPSHPFLLIGAAAVALLWSASLGPGGVLVLFATVELALVAVASHVPAFRRRVDRRIAERERERAAEQRATLLTRMGREHQIQLFRLEQAVDAIDACGATRGEPVGVVVERCRALVALFVKLAIAHESARRLLTSVDRHALSAQIRALDDARASVAAPALPCVERRLAIARKRMEQWERAREHMSAIAAQLGAIADRLLLAREESAAPPDVARLMNEEVHVRVARDLAELARSCDDEELVDGRMLALAREARGCLAG